MPYFSGSQIENMIENSVIHANLHPRIDVASIDLTVGHIYRSLPHKHVDDKETFEDFIANCCEEVDIKNGKALLPKTTMHAAYTREHFDLPKRIFGQVTSRSSAARCFLRIDSDVQFDRQGYGRIPLILNSFGPGAIIKPDQKYVQMFLNDGCLHLMGGQLLAALNSGDIALSLEGKKLGIENFLDYGNSHLVLTLDPVIDIVHDDKPIDVHSCWTDFERIDLSREGIRLEAGISFLASTRERITLSENYIGELQMFYRPIPMYGMTVHPNAPMHNPGSDSTMVLECRTDTDMLLKAGMPVAAMKIHRMHSPASYNGRYAGQSGVVRSKAFQGL